MILYKYHLTICSEQLIRMPSPQQFRAVQVQGRKLCVWYEVNDKPSSDDFIDIQFMLVGTGDLAPVNAHYLGTVQKDGFVWHVYARRQHG